MPVDPIQAVRPIVLAVAAWFATATGLASGQTLPPDPARAPVARAPAVDTDRITRDIEWALDQADTFRWNAFAQVDGVDLDFDFDPSGPSFAFISREFGAGGEIVKNAPYQAEAISESIQILADGNRIVRRSSTLVARDGLGRTRQEHKGGTVYLFDPIERRSYALNAERKTAMRIPRAPRLAAPPAPPPPPTPPAMSAPPPPTPSPPGSPAPAPAPSAHETQRVIVKRGGDGKAVAVSPGQVVVKRSSEVDGQRHEEVHVEVFRIGRDGAPARDAIAPAPHLALPILPRGPGDVKKLGSRDIDGVKADGTMTTHTIPAGEIGNEKPIVVTSERWFSPELHVVVYAKHSDPRTGETIYRLSGLKRGEPSAELFKVPGDYRVRGDPRRP